MLLKENSEDAMRPGWWIIHECGWGWSVQCSFVDEVDHLIRGGDSDFIDPADTDRAIFFFSDGDEVFLHFDFFVAFSLIVGE